MLEKIETIDMIEVLNIGHVQVRVKISIIENGQQISNSFRRYVIAPGDDYSNQDERVKAICLVTHTQEVIDAYKAMIEESGV